jgi:hypothetical protein
VGGGVIQIISEFVIAKTSYKFTFLLKLKIKLIKYYYYYRYKYNSLAKSPPSIPHSPVPSEDTSASNFLILSNNHYHIHHKTIFKFEETLAKTLITLNLQNHSLNQPFPSHKSNYPSIILSIISSTLSALTPLFFSFIQTQIESIYHLFNLLHQSFNLSFIALLITHLSPKSSIFSSPIYPIFFLF